MNDIEERMKRYQMEWEEKRRLYQEKMKRKQERNQKKIEKQRIRESNQLDCSSSINNEKEICIEANQILSKFKEEAKKTWDNSELINKIEFNAVIEEEQYMKNPMSISYQSRPRIIGETLVSVPRKMTLHINKNTLKMPEEKLKKVLIHESVHIGIPSHGEQFIKKTQKHQGCLTVHHLESGQFEIQVKEGSRFKTIKTFNSLAEAKKYQIESKLNRCRIRF